MLQFLDIILLYQIHLEVHVDVQVWHQGIILFKHLPAAVPMHCLAYYSIHPFCTFEEVSDSHKMKGVIFYEKMILHNLIPFGSKRQCVCLSVT